jgi:hypothetical protein
MDNPIRAALEGWTADQWVQGRYGTVTEKSCLVGRLRKFPLHFNAFPFIWKVLAEQYGEGWSTVGIEVWNDIPGRTFAEVVSVMEKAAVRWDETYG